MTIDLIINTFIQHFKEHPETVVQSPGKVNFLGEHTGYNQGLALTAAIDKEILFAAKKNDENTLRFYSVDFKESFEIKLRDVEKTEVGWVNYLLGVAERFKEHGNVISGIDVVFGGDVPVGAGLSSSSALTAGFAKVLNELFEFKLSENDLVKISQLAEEGFAGVKSGIMDHLTILNAKSEYAMMIDSRSLDYDFAPALFEGYSIILVDTKVKHALASTVFGLRKRECKTAVEKIKIFNPEIKSLRDVTAEMLEKYKPELDENIYKRVKFIADENDRVYSGFEALNINDLDTFGRLMYESHEGLKNEYEVSCDELDILVDIAAETGGVIGSKMMGKGLGGCTINIVENEFVEKFKEKASKIYEKSTGQKPEFYNVRIAGGARVIMDNK